MRNSYYVSCGKYRKFEKPKISYLFKKTLVFSIICSNCENEDDKLFKEKESIEILNILGLIENMVKENITQEFRLKNIDQTRNYFLVEIEQNQLISKKHKKVCTTLNYIEHFLILAPTITGCIFVQ